MLNSTVSWIDFAETDRYKMMEVIALFKERDTRDELGIGSIRDALADLFFPGTSTLQTRARYFLFVPWLYLRYERHKVPSAKIVQYLRQDEIQLITALKSANEEGIIGQRSGASLQRFPSSVYWKGLQRWGILRYPGAQSQYHRWLDHFYALPQQRTEYDNQEPVEGWGKTHWNLTIPAPEDFPNRVNLDLTQAEAGYLQGRLQSACHGSLLMTLVDTCAPVEAIEFIWQHPQLADFPRQQQTWIRHARYFSETLHGAALLYNLMLAELREDDGLVETYQSAVQEWQDSLTTTFGELLRWDQRAFWQLVKGAGHIPLTTERFVNQWLGFVLAAANPPALIQHSEGRHLVREREIQLKRGRSRFESRRHLELWSGAAGTAPVDYRWPVVRRITNDILCGGGRR